MLDPKISIDIYITLPCDRNRQGRDAICDVRIDFGYNILSAFLRKVENIFFDILLFLSKPITVGTIYWPLHPTLVKVIF